MIKTLEMKYSDNIDYHFVFCNHPIERGLHCCINACDHAIMQTNYRMSKY